MSVETLYAVVKSCYDQEDNGDWCQPLLICNVLAPNMMSWDVIITFLRQKQREEKQEHFHKQQWHCHRPNIRDTRVSLSTRHFPHKTFYPWWSKGFIIISLLEIRSRSESSVFCDIFFTAQRICWELVSGLCLEMGRNSLPQDSSLNCQLPFRGHTKVWSHWVWP